MKWNGRVPAARKQGLCLTDSTFFPFPLTQEHQRSEDFIMSGRRVFRQRKRCWPSLSRDAQSNMKEDKMGYGSTLVEDCKGTIFT